MNLWYNLFIPKPSKMRRSTHHHCAFCGTNLENYGQETCRCCLLSLKKEDGMVVLASELGQQMGWFKLLYLSIRSLLLRVKASFTRNVFKNKKI